MCLPVIFKCLESDEFLPMMRWYAREEIEERKMIPMMPIDDVIELLFQLMPTEES